MVTMIVLGCVFGWKAGVLAAVLMIVETAVLQQLRGTDAN